MKGNKSDPYGNLKKIEEKISPFAKKRLEFRKYKIEKWEEQKFSGLF